MRGLITTILIVVSAISAGCASAPGEESPCWAQWARQHGDLLSGPSLDRSRAVMARLSPALSDRMPTVNVLNDAVPSANAWPDGSIFVTAGLLKALDDDELAAAMAHEMGHLLSDGRLRPAMALSGGPGGDVEIRADGIACQLLKTSGIPPRKLADALRKVERSTSLDASQRGAMDVRIAIIESRFGQ